MALTKVRTGGLTDDAVTTDKLYTPNLGRRNLIINGAMQVSQRGTSETGVTSGQYANAPDRFKVEMSSAGTWTVSQSTTAPSGFSNSYKFDCTTADASLSAGDYLHLSHYLEGQNLQQLKKGASDAEKVTLSFYVRSNKTGTYIVEFYDADNARSISKSYTISSADTFEKKTITIDGDTTGAFGNDNGGSLGIFFFLGAGSNFTSGTLNTSWGSRTLANVAVGQVNLADSTDNEWYITGVQLEVGSVATPFEHRSYGEEITACQRYYYKRTSNSSNIDEFGIAIGGGTDKLVYYNLPVQMRALPSVTRSDANTFGTWPRASGGTMVTMSTWYSSSGVDEGKQLSFMFTCSGTGDVERFGFRSTSGFFEADAEL